MAFSSADLLRAMTADAGLEVAALRVDGGAAANDWLMQFQADVLGVPVERPDNVETTALGAGGLAGIALAETLLQGMAAPVVMLMVVAWLLSGALSSLLAATGFVDALVWAARALDLRGGLYAGAAFVVCALVSTSTGTSFGTLLIADPLNLRRRCPGCTRRCCSARSWAAQPSATASRPSPTRRLPRRAHSGPTSAARCGRG